MVGDHLHSEGLLCQETSVHHWQVQISSHTSPLWKVHEQVSGWVWLVHKQVGVVSGLTGGCG